MAENTFAVVIGRLAEKIKGDLDLVTRKAGFELFYKIVLRSPVGNPSLWASKPPKGYVGGQFRANWNLSIGQADTTTRKTTRQQRGFQQAQKILTTSGKVAGKIVWFSNGLPYAQELEQGHSTQAPNGMVRVSVAEFDRFMKRALGAK